MGLFSDIISSIGNGVSDLFGGGNNNNDQKKRQQQQNAPAPAPGPVRLPAVFQTAPQQQNNPLRPVNFGPAPGANPLQPQQPQAPVAAPQINTTNYGAPAPQPQQHQSLFGSLLHAAGNAVDAVGTGAKDVGSAVAGTALAATRVGEGLVQGVTSLPDLAVRADQFANAKLLGTPEGLPVVNAVNKATNTVNAPVNLLAQKTDQAAQAFGQPGADIYKPAQIVGNVATIVPAAAAVAGKIGEAGNVTSKIADFAKAQSEISTLSKVPVLGTVLSHIPGLGADDETAGAGGEKAPVESGTKAPVETANAPAGEKNAPPEKAPNAVETGVKPPSAPPEEPGVPAEKAPVAAPAAVAPTLEKTGDTGQDLQNATGLVKNVLENGRDYSGEQPNLQNVLDLANSHLHSNDVVAKALNDRLGTHLSDTEAQNVRNAIETGSTKGLSDKEAGVVKVLQENIEQPSNATRTSLSPDYQAADNHFPQVRQTSVKDAVQGASRAKGVSGKLNTFNDLLNRNSRFSEGSSLGTFTSGGKSITGDANDLGLVAKKDGTFVDKAGKVYNYSRATSQDLENAGTKLQAPKDALTAYVRDTLNLKTRADAADYLIKNSDGLGLSDTPKPGSAEPVSIKGSDGTEHSLFTDKKTAASIKDSGILGNLSKEASLPTKAWNALSSLIAQASVVNPFAHGLNLATNAAVGAGERANGITGLSTLARSFKPIDEATELRMSDAGVHFPTYGKDNVNAISKATGGLSKLNEKAVAVIDRQARAGMFDNLTKGGMSDKEAANTINKWMGGRSVYKGDNAQLGIFWKYFVRQNANAGRMLVQAAKGHPGALVNAAIAGGATFAADKGLKDVTGNQGAYVHAPGVVGIINDAGTGAKDLATGQYRNAVNPLVTHINPLVTQAAEQTLGVNNYGDKFPNGAARVANLEGITPETNAFNNNGHSLPEKALNTFGIYTPHVKGDEAAAPGTIPGKVLNVNGAQSGASVAFPKDFTGEQESNVANKLGNNYSTKAAAILGSQPQSQQQKYLQATTTLKKYGITDATDVENFSKLSPKDQGSYVDAVDALNKAGTAVSTSNVQGQLVKNGNVALAAGMNKGIPNSLPQEAKNTLETYSTLGSDGQKNVWLQNNDNADNYYKSVIAQKQANGALTTDDTDVGAAYSGSGGSLYVKALVAETNKQNNVPQSLVEQYKNTTKTEYDKMSGTEKTELTNYAQQLNKNGVIDKFGLATGTSGSSSGSSSTSASAEDRAAGLPYGTISESFVKPTSDPGVKSVSARAFTQPTLAKYTPDTKGNPFVRSISVSKGVK